MAVLLAHEAYVLTPQQFNEGLKVYSQNPLSPLLSPEFIKITGIITLCVIAVYILNFIWASSSLSSKIDNFIKKGKVFGPFIIRIAIGSSLLFSALSNVIFGPELRLSLVPGGEIIRIILFAASIMFFLGFLTELAGLVGILIFFYVAFTNFNFYMVTYFNYLGELIVLFLFGLRFFSIDRLLFGSKILFKKLKNYTYLEIPIVRIMYGIALIYAGFTIKFLHQGLTVLVYNQYNLQQFFHAGASFIAAGAGLSEILIGLLIILGLGQRLTVIISLVFITLSLLYFRELVWPHFMLYGISLSLIINSADEFTLDRKIVPFVRKLIHV